MNNLNSIYNLKEENQPGINNRPIGGAGILLYCKSTKKILLMLRNDYNSENSWCIPGGGIDPGETPIEAAIREVYEEAFIKHDEFSIISDTPIYSNKLSDTFTFHTFYAECDSELVPQLNFEHSKWGWFNYNELPKPLHPGIVKMFNEIDMSFIC